MPKDRPESLDLEEIANEIAQVEGVAAVVLGGSRARGDHSETSDIDLGIYYDPEKPFGLEALQAIATRIDDEHRPGILTPLGGWGPWINGGGWLRVNKIAVDFLYRDLEKVRRVIRDCRGGEFEIFYQPGHPLGFISPIYMGEAAVCRILADPRGDLAALKAQTQPYPEKLKVALIRRFSWEAHFSLEIAGKGAYRGDVNYVAGCLFRASGCLLQTLFALNETYWLNEKGAARLAEQFSRRPARLQERIEQAFQVLSPATQALEKGIQALAELVGETDQLTRQVIDV